jgi:branched-chain amino acid transport system permease protein
MRVIGLAALVMCALAAPHLFYPVFLMQALCFAIYATAFNLLFGYVGLLSFGHAAFFGTAAYVAGYALKDLGWTPEMAIGSGVLVSAIVGLVVGGLAIRRQGIYFAMITFALAEVVYFVCLQAPFTGGEDGLQSVPRGKLFGLLPLQNDLVMYYVVLAVFFMSLAAVYRIVHSPFGRVLVGIRDNEVRVQSLGYDVGYYKLMAFVLSAGLSGLAGGTKTAVMHFASLSDAHWHRSGEVVLMALIGGVNSLLGPSVGAVLVVTLYETMAGFGDWVTFIIGASFVMCVLMFRSGIMGLLERLWQKWRNSAQQAEVSSTETPARDIESKGLSLRASSSSVRAH